MCSRKRCEIRRLRTLLLGEHVQPVLKQLLGRRKNKIAAVQSAASDPCGTTWVDKRGLDGKVKCRIAMHGFNTWVPTVLRYAALPLRVTLRLLLT